MGFAYMYLCIQSAIQVLGGDWRLVRTGGMVMY
jgi:hypothetical protein